MITTSTIRMHAQLITIKDQYGREHTQPALLADGTGLALHRLPFADLDSAEWRVTHVQSGFGIGIIGCDLRNFKEARAFLVDLSSKVDLDIDLKTFKQRHMARKVQRTTFRNILFTAWQKATGCSYYRLCQRCGRGYPVERGFYIEQEYSFCADCASL